MDVALRLHQPRRGKATHFLIQASGNTGWPCPVCETYQHNFDHLTFKKHIRRVWDRLDEAMVELELPNGTYIDEVYSDARVWAF